MVELILKHRHIYQQRSCLILWCLGRDGQIAMNDSPKQRKMRTKHNVTFRVISVLAETFGWVQVERQEKRLSYKQSKEKELECRLPLRCLTVGGGVWRPSGSSWVKTKWISGLHRPGSGGGVRVLLESYCLRHVTTTQTMTDWHQSGHNSASGKRKRSSPEEGPGEAAPR